MCRLQYVTCKWDLQHGVKLISVSGQGPDPLAPSFNVVSTWIAELRTNIQPCINIEMWGGWWGCHRLEFKTLHKKLRLISLGAVDIYIYMQM